MQENWFHNAAQSFSPRALNDHPVYNVDAILRGYEVLFEYAGVGLVCNIRQGRVVVAIKTLWQDPRYPLPFACFALIRSLSSPQWEESKQEWLDIAARLAELRVGGWRVGIEALWGLEGQSLVVAHPLNDYVMVDLPRVIEAVWFNRVKRVLAKVSTDLRLVDDCVSDTVPTFKSGEDVRAACEARDLGRQTLRTLLALLSTRSSAPIDTNSILANQDGSPQSPISQATLLPSGLLE
jgi:hypothetical protein